LVNWRTSFVLTSSSQICRARVVPFTGSVHDESYILTVRRKPQIGNLSAS
jgi:hypothetical protein